MLALLALLAHAADEAPSVQHANYLLGRGAHVEASSEAGELLTANPDDLAAHHAYVSARSRSHGGEQLVPMYRAWLEAEPDRVGARFGLAAALARATRDAGPCAELTGLLEPLPDDALTRFWTVRVRASVAKPCGWDGDALKDELIALGAEVPEARRHALHLRISDGLDDALVADLRSAYAEAPESLGVAWMLWSADRKGPLVSRARKDALAAAEGIEADSEDPRALHYAAAVLRAAGEGKRAAALDAEVTKLDPIAAPADRQEPTPLARDLYDANRKPTHELALATLDAMADRLPASGPDRATWLALRADRLEALGREDEAYAAVRDAALADPTAAHRGNAFAWHAAVRGEDLDAALGAIERSLAWLYAQSWDPAGRVTWEDWAEDHRSSLAGWEDTRGWVLHRMGRDEEARVALERAVLFASVPDLHAHLGVVLEALGEHAAAFEQLALASEAGEPLSEEVAAPAREALARLWPTAGIWHPSGLEGWLAARSGDGDDEDEDDGDESERAPHPLVGQPFPIDEVTRLAGGETSLAAVKGVKVVDLWATWCGPCVAGMPHLKQVAAAYEDRGVTVVGVSVDQQIAPVKRFFQGAGDLGYDIAWIGQPGYDLAKVDGIPALFVVDADGKVFEFIQGYGEGDKRLEAALDKVLAR